ncbi:unnamed protein product [Heligmosomoides polygyrus]|uniref:Secreted protein n=1 Tax=Heligmosomoides polygyrus TaxID=6339 RepID=A0A183GQ78_HELPZ|nr:unnamed protein product [Heligmosomoides polygyrus]
MSMVGSIKAGAGGAQHLRTGRQLLSMGRLLKTALLLTILHYASAFDIFAMVGDISGLTETDLRRYMAIADDAVRKDLKVVGNVFRFEDDIGSLFHTIKS